MCVAGSPLEKGSRSRPSLQAGLPSGQLSVASQMKSQRAKEYPTLPE